MKTYKDYEEYMLKMAHLNAGASILHWDQEVNMPPKGAVLRAQQNATIQGVVYELSVDSSFYNLVKSLLSDKNLSFVERRNLEETKLGLDKAKRLNIDFVKDLSLAISRAFQDWNKAKEANDFSLYKKALTDIVELSREKAGLIGYTDSPYDALLDEYEPGLTCAHLEEVFGKLKRELVPLVAKIAQAEQVDDSFMYKSYDENKQWDFSIDLLKIIGFDFEAGRQDKSIHPFTLGVSPDDVRLTTRIKENDLAEVIWSAIHEGGHGLYEQGLPSNQFGFPAGSYLSLSFHESQSRIWENNIGRALPFWENAFPLLKKYFPDELKGVSERQFFCGMNKVKPSLIRTSADELTYHIHVIIRYEIEKALIEGDIEVEDLEDAWNSKYEEYLGVFPKKASEGVLQDVHWAHGSFGYFPTYSLGSLYAAQFFEKAKTDIPHLEELLKKGNCTEFLNWTRKKIHTHGKLYSADDLCTNITGEKLNSDYFVKYAKEKYSDVYNIKLD